MLKHLVNEALRDVWCSPRQDNLHILQLHRLTAKYGSLGVANVLGRDVSLPSTGKRFHVYQIGQISPAYFGMLTISPVWASERWTAFSTAIDATNVQADIYTDKGVMLPRFKAYYMFNSDRNMIVAIEIIDKVKAELDFEDVYIRFYKNAKFRNLLGVTPGEGLKLIGDIPLSNERVVQLTNSCRQYKSKEGYVSCYVNGVAVDTIDPYNVKVGDVVEFLYDSTVFKVITISADTMPVFHSELDLCLKYIIHYPGKDPEYIIYNDDIDIEVIYDTAPNRYKGLNYNRNILSSLRNITHRDYSLPVDNVVKIVGDIQLFDSNAPITHSSYKLKIKFKESPVIRPLIRDSNKIFELYRLDDEDIVRAMTGTNSTVDFWHASKLETSPYIQLMSSKYEDLNLKLVQEAYGYGGTTTTVANSPLKVVTESSRLKVTLPLAYRINSTCYEYDSQGTLLDRGYVSENDDYYCKSPRSAIIEPIVGEGLPNNGDVYGEDNITLPRFDYRVYMTYKRDGVVDNSKWKDVTDTEHYRVEDGVIKWNYHEIEQWLCVRDDAHFYSRDFVAREDSGILRVKITELLGDFENDMVIPRGDIDIFLNGKSLVNKLDYFVKLPYLYINNHKHLNRPALNSDQRIHVRMTGFCDREFNPVEVVDFGFIRHGALSDNNRFDVRDDKVLRITVDGALKLRDSVVFSEDSAETSVINSINGQPYQIKNCLIPIRDLVESNTYSFRDEGLVRDKVVSDYLGSKNVTPDKGPISAIPERYRVVSPFLNRVTHFLREDIITDDMISSNFNDMWIEERLSAEMHLLEIDPINGENRLSDDYVIVTPHRYNNRVTLSVLKLRFLNRLIQLYSCVAIDLRQFYLVNEEL